MVKFMWAFTIVLFGFTLVAIARTWAGYDGPHVEYNTVVKGGQVYN